MCKLFGIHSRYVTLVTHYAAHISSVCHTVFSADQQNSCLLFPPQSSILVFCAVFLGISSGCGGQVLSLVFMMYGGAEQCRVECRDHLRLVGTGNVESGTLL